MNVRGKGFLTPNAKGKRRRSTEGAQGTNKGHENAEGMVLVGVRLTDQLGRERDRRQKACIAHNDPPVIGAMCSLCCGPIYDSLSKVPN